MDTGRAKRSWKKKDGQMDFNFQEADVGRLLDKQPPHSMEAEMSLLGSMILDWKIIGEIVQVIKSADDFYKPSHGAIYRALTDLYETAKSLDLVQLTEVLRDRKVLDDIGGSDYLVELVEGTPNAVNAPYYAEIVRSKAQLRELIEAAGKIIHTCYHATDPTEEIVDRAEKEIFQLRRTNSAHEATKLAELVQETYTKLESPEGLSRSGVPTGYRDLNDMLNGLQKSEMLILAARPSMGKTAFAMNIAENIAVDHKIPVAVFSLEMGKQALAQRLLCARSGVDGHKIRRNMLSTHDFTQLQIAVGELSEAPIYVDDTPGLSLLAFRAKARRLKSQYDIQAIFIDYLQLMTAPGSESRQQEVSSISRGIKEVARELDVPIVCLSQLNRNPEGRESKRPMLSDLRESGSIEQDADVVMMLHREDYYKRTEEDFVPTNSAECIIAKQRNGPAGVVKLHFNTGTTRFEDAAPGHLTDSDGVPA